MMNEPDKLDDKNKKAEVEANTVEAEKKRKEPAQSAEDKKSADLAAKKKISRDEAKKEVAREEIKQETGYSAASLADVGKTVLHANESTTRHDVKQAGLDMSKVKGNAVEGMLEKIADPKIAKKVIQAGLGSEFLSTGESGLEQGARTVLELTKKFGDEKGIENMLADAAIYGSGVMSLQEIKSLTPDVLKEKLAQWKQQQNTATTAQKNTVQAPIPPNRQQSKEVRKEQQTSSKDLSPELARELANRQTRK